MASNFSSINKTLMRQIVILNLSCCYLLSLMMPSYAETDTLLQGQVMWDEDYRVSANKIFRLKFFRPGTSDNNLYLGIFYNTESKDIIFPDDDHPVWVANRDTPVGDSIFTMLWIDDSDGLLKISYFEGNITISNSIPGVKNTSATILDNGNLVLRALSPDGEINRTLWQSFDYPTDTLLPGMKLGINFRTGHRWSLTSWISNQVPASGSFILGGDPNGSSQLMVWWQGNAYWISGLWDDNNFHNTFHLIDITHHYLNFTYISNENDKYLTYSVLGGISWAKVSMLSNGMVETSISNNLFNLRYFNYRYSICPLSRNITPSGCLMEMLPKCRKDDFEPYERQGSIIGYGYQYDQNHNMSLFDCEVECRQNCSCIAYASLDYNGTGCEIFDKDIMFIPRESRQSQYQLSDRSDGRVVYFLDTGKETSFPQKKKNSATSKWWIWLVVAAGGTLMLITSSIVCFFVLRYFIRKDIARKTLVHELADTTIAIGQHSEKKMKNVHLFSFESLEMATDNFSTANKLGEGGFGSVYKGKLLSGQEIAIKRLSRSSGQGLSEFKNEIRLIAKLQHDNLVRLLGCCMKGQEKFLVYEYLPNRSLDFFIFAHSCRRELLNWTNRMNIIEGVAQGLLYLHKYSRLRIIHQDLKASNILLDQNLNPKISDFGMARIFRKQASEANTNRIVGTHGYMPPEYAIKGVFSTKTDIFSFGVLLLEIVSGKKNHGCYHSERPLNLIGLAWELWTEGKALELIDPTLDGSNHKNEMIRCINVGLLCVQDDSMDRPSMTEVISMMTNESLQLPEPKQPFFIGSSSTREDEKEVALEKPCTNGLSISDMQAGR